MSTPLLENILNQGAALQQVLHRQMGAGRDALLRAAEAIRRSSRVVVSGMGASHYAGLVFARSLAIEGKPVAAIDSAELLHFCGSQLDSATALVLISRSGESVEVTKLLPQARERGSAVIGISNVVDSQLSRGSGVPIHLDSPADQMVAIQTYSSTVAVLLLLNACLRGELDLVAADLERTAAELTQWIPVCVQSRDTWTNFVGGAQPLYILGRGLAMASVTEGVLLMHETAKSAAVGMNAAEFRHGPVEAVDGRFRGVILGTQRETKSLDANLASDLAGMGADVRWIGPVPEGTHVHPLCPWPSDIPETMFPIAEVIPLQILAYKKAELLGIRPGDFRWAPLVTTTESGFSAGSRP